MIKTQVELRRKIIQLEENIKDWERQCISYRDAFYSSSDMNKDLSNENAYLRRRVESLDSENRKIQEMSNERVRNAYSQIGR